jgi:hypothetical protein
MVETLSYFLSRHPESFPELLPDSCTEFFAIRGTVFHRRFFSEFLGQLYLARIPFPQLSEALHLHSLLQGHIPGSSFAPSPPFSPDFVR